MDELTIRPGAASLDRIITEYRSLDGPSAFFTLGPELR